MDLNPDVKNALWIVLGAVAATAVGSIPKAWKGLKKEIGDEAVHREAEFAMAKDIGALGVQLRDLKEDIDGVAKMSRTRFAKLEKKDTALETMLTGELPRITGETEVTDA
jgi:hypothetical protein